jgi:hypothetical protein
VKPDRRTLRDSPYLADHAASLERRDPSGFAGYLAWFLDGFAAETPGQTRTDPMHAGGVWFGRPSEGLAGELTGGSVLGAPRQGEGFRQLLENSPYQTVDHDTPDERYVRPMRAALARLSSRGDGDAPFMARYLLAVAYSQGDWPAVTQRWFPLTPYVGRAFTEQALKRLHGTYREAPPVRYVVKVGWTSLSESQRSAIVEGEVAS